MIPGKIIAIEDIPDRVDADLRRYYREQEMVERYCKQLEDYSDDELIDELEGRGWICIRESELGTDQ